jgi:hypothetical protein
MSSGSFFYPILQRGRGTALTIRQLVTYTQLVPLEYPKPNISFWRPLI